ncbi:ATP phosphoribosyltransferase (ATP-PRTase) (ATP-PRT) [Lodderomyces elongisporus]|uniref:ATP phosphoribosyltransferase n=1 Tax=Lodderomyces elongisporus (strain ATCC 11503 / CBS 2605 / JCM 1781 / NBRC 1676 / NRRL YB-4239) TaxID=379508 RepID=A5E3B2_LODEL|nr:ATP phosphoribosyltransferase (ATP-PRTase) (ATP-PRT) [Lodderomyces elongisporus]EDK45920.1 ATP phosphoribosyltransferase [Lodderomyces elongisporus NRRL YB-4239]WLF81124.1 ATP phosphoribosyltransferase (ATP-PRTase) (ATP-PRT) [Lodderomyces elongisporus]
MDLVNHLPDRLLFAVPKKGRLYEKCCNLLSGADIQFRRSNRLDIALSTNLPIALIFLPAADIPVFVGEGNCDLGITGLDQIMEADQFENIEDLLDLKFGSCKLQVQVPANGPFDEPEQLVGKKIVSSFTKLATDYFEDLKKNKKDAATDNEKINVRYVGGSVEASCALGVADAIVDLVESGETMKAAGLKAIGTVLTTSAHLISSKKPKFPEVVKMIDQRIQGVLAAQEFVLCNYNAPKSIMTKCLEITPGKRSPTISTLEKHFEEEEDWVAISSMVPRKKIGDVMDRLKAAGASDILVLEISNCRV